MRTRSQATTKLGEEPSATPTEPETPPPPLRRSSRIAKDPPPPKEPPVPCKEPPTPSEDPPAPPKERPVPPKEPPAPSHPLRRSSRIAEDLPPSPNLQTRATRLNKGTTVSNSYVERERIAKIRKQFKHHYKKPCSVFGLEREARYRGGFFFCLNCEYADNKERAQPQLKVNRFSGLFGCVAEHKNGIYPTDRMVDEKKRRLKKLAEQQRQKKAKADKEAQQEICSLPNSDSLEPESKESTHDLSTDPSHSNEAPPCNPLQDNEPDESSKPPSQQSIAMTVHTNEPNLTWTQPEVVNCPSQSTKPPRNPHEDQEFASSPKNPPPVPTTDAPSTQTLIPPPDDDGVESDRIPEDDGFEDTIDKSITPRSRNHPSVDLNRGLTIPEILDRSDATSEAATTSREETEEEKKQYTVSLVNGLLMQVESLKKKLSKEGQKNATLKRRLSEQRAKNKSRLDRIYYLQKKIENSGPEGMASVPSTCSKEENAEMIVRHIKEVIQSSVKNHQVGSQRSDKFFRMLTNMLMSDNLHGTQVRDIIVKAVSNYLRQTCFSPFRILREMDTTGGVLSLSGLEILRKCESDGRKGAHTMIPSSAAMKKAQQEIERFADTIVPFRTIRNTKDGSEGFIFRGADSMKGVLRTNNALEGEAKEREHTVASTMDGASLTKSLDHTLGGFKYNDISNPLQRSQAACVPTCCVIGREKKNTVRGLFSRMLKENKEAAEKVLPKAFGIKKVYNPLNADMSCDFKVSDKGGAVKVAKFPCAKCHISSDNLTKGLESPDECKWCDHWDYTSTEDGWMCRHFPICTDDYVQVRQDEMKKFEKDMPQIKDKIEEIWGQSKIAMNKTMDPRMPVDEIQLTTVTSIHFDVTKASATLQKRYSSWLNKDLGLRNLSLDGNVLERQDRLRRQLISEWQYVDCTDCIRLFGEGKVSTALVMVMDSIPCILHMEMRMGQKILTMCFRTGLMNAKNNLLPWINRSNRSSVEKKCKSFLRGIEQCINSEILGTGNLAFQFQIPFEDTTKTIGVVQMSNVQIRRMIADIEKLVDKCIVDEDDVFLWKRAMQHYSASFQLLRIREPMTNDQIFEYQKHADLFYRDWIELYGDDGITNYAHYIGSGHIGEYLLHWRNLTNHSQQGWEAFNSAFKSFYFNRTQRGGAVNRGQGARSRLRPMARWIQRRMVFMLGYDLETMRAEMDARTPEEEEKFKTWVRDNGGTIEFGQLVRHNKTANDESKDEEDEDEDEDEDGVKEYEFDWDVGVEILYDPRLDDSNDLDADSEDSTTTEEEYESE